MKKEDIKVYWDEGRHDTIYHYLVLVPSGAFLEDFWDMYLANDKKIMCLGSAKLEYWENCMSPDAIGHIDRVEVTLDDLPEKAREKLMDRLDKLGR